ncbi:TlpA family protein disulfide reductase [Sulfurovum mangrovi]|uniref:TlpA family protein disulfide reductase n=1 Tax=Sulfurovum mangrovi TaxID=2893889 RepID=UPI001E40C15C|nr:TlpA disulfide reductase family protein [Sulfurovum mangrovi]UFH59671.1 TlpA family protein disulfide reductase [Sulfurovum mangrovi]UFH60816.1 TlpA family protein disulfide reductase [Sulfurovum mangrovi]
MKKLLTLFFLIVSLGTWSYAEEQPDLTFKDINGKTVQIKGAAQGLDIPSLKGKVVFLEFFGHKCPPCLMSIPHLVELQKKYKEKLAIVSVEVQGMNEEALKDFVFEKGINYTVSTERNARILVNYIAARAEWNGSIPFMVAMDTKGNVQFVQAGMIPQDYLENLIAQLSK